MVFNRYSNYYDSFYAEKDYAAECDFVELIFDKFTDQSIKGILDLGCGTGGHTVLLAQRGYQLSGVDLSESMLSIARSKAKELSLTIDYHLQDMRQLHLEQTFDAAVSMFAVMGYQTSNYDLEQAIQGVRQHLSPGGLFIFDGWFGPAVLSERPVERTKIIETDAGRIIRHARPELDVVNHVVKVFYNVLHLQGHTLIDEIDEVHTMRFFFYQEIEYFLEKNGFELLKISPFMELDRAIAVDDWNMTVICRRV
ncbi:MAG: class I SAM-dependent methyltransferase [Anaerolineales bacterium]|nr:class I SAM-dependent methyltransferase [Chloroflexota bacterium]MBL6982427.1 class I SAM-dependent methyltransferase [Anaerolineales bacterium]